MRKLVVVTAFAAVALATQQASACDWNREATSEQQQIAATTPPAPAPQATSTATQTPAVASESTSQSAAPTAPVVLINDRH
jgi:hypothetical protein